MTGTPLGAFIAAVAALLTLFAGLGLVRARTHGDAVVAFAVAGVLCGVATAAAGALAAGAVMMGATGMLSVTAYAAASRSRKPTVPTRRNRPVVGAVAIAAIVCIASWSAAPAGTRAIDVSGSNGGGAGALFAGMSLLLGVTGVAAAVLGRGERGVLGPDRGEAP